MSAQTESPTGSQEAVPASNLPPEAQELIRPYLEGTLAPDEAAFVEDLAARDPEFAKALEARRWLINKMNAVYGERRLTESFRETTGQRLRAIAAGTSAAEKISAAGAEQEEELVAAAGPSFLVRLGGAPWWFVSTALHALILLLVGLLSLSLMDDRDAQLIVVTRLEQPPKLEPKEEEPAPRDVMENPVKVEPNDPNADKSNVIVPPDLVAQLADHFETDSQMPTTEHEAGGVPDSNVFRPSDSQESGGGGDDGLLVDDIVGVGGAGSKGSGGGAGGGAGTGFGTGTGSGSGSFGQRGGQGQAMLLRRNGGNGRTQSAVDHALEWLAKHQEADGHWDPRKYEGGINEGTNETGATGLALLAFLGAGHSERVGKYRETVQKAVKWFMENQGKDGQFKCKTDPGSCRMYGHAIAAMAMCEAAAMGKKEETRKSAQLGVEFVEKSQIRTGGDESIREGWDYTPSFHGGKTTDTSVTSWMALALKSAKMGGFHIDPATFEGVTRWLEASQGPDDYKLGCWYRGTLAEVKPQQAANPKMEANNPPLRENALLAACASMRMFIMGTPATDGRIMATADHLRKRLPEWKPNGQTCFYHLYYGTLTMFQVGGPHWTDWNKALQKMLLPNQVVGGDNDGSWDPSVDWLTKYGGRVYTTAMGALSLEVYYRYLRLNGK